MAKGFTVACMEYFGKRDGQTLMDFAKEVKALTHQDKLDLAPLLTVAMGLDADNAVEVLPAK